MVEVFIAPPGTDPTEPGWSWLGTTEDQASQRPFTLRRVAAVFDVPLNLITPEETTPDGPTP
ncbi:hypothetical protein [Nocardiopsis sp. FR26]|uniref:hypothetical protein n=1 Tax=Nocardiopsis sp. FR26 TaxID=2605987 RepID=UPI00135BB4D8|nr:hypothetical protein [Nocardiopsis sp. FR26]